MIYFTELSTSFIIMSERYKEGYSISIYLTCCRWTKFSQIKFWWWLCLPATHSFCACKDSDESMSCFWYSVSADRLERSAGLLDLLMIPLDSLDSFLSSFFFLVFLSFFYFLFRIKRYKWFKCRGSPPVSIIWKTLIFSIANQPVFSD